MIGEVEALKALAGYRGSPPGDLDALAQALVALSRLAVIDGPAVAEAEVNPLIVREPGEGVVAVDALVRLMALTDEDNDDRSNSRAGERRRRSGPPRAPSQHRPFMLGVGDQATSSRSLRAVSFRRRPARSWTPTTASRCARRATSGRSSGASTPAPGFQRHFRPVQARQAGHRGRPASSDVELALLQGPAGQAARPERDPQPCAPCCATGRAPLRARALNRLWAAISISNCSTAGIGFTSRRPARAFPCFACTPPAPTAGIPRPAQ